MDLSTFLSILKKNDDLLLIEKNISTNLEIARITRFLSKRTNKAFLFKNIKGSKYPIATNIFGSKKRIITVLGVKKWEEISKKGEKLLSSSVSIPTLEVAESIKDFTILEGSKIKLSHIGALVQWDNDQNPYISMANIITEDHETKKINSGIYRIEIEPSGSLWLYFYKGSDIYKHINKKTPLLCSIAIGTPCLFNLLSALKMPKGISELDAYYLIKNNPLKIISFKSYPPAPYLSQFIIFGQIIKTKSYRCAYFGNFKGIYDKYYSNTIIEPHYLFIAKEAINLASIIDTPPCETSLIFKVAEKLFLPLWQKQIPEIKEVIIPEETGFNQLAIICLEETSNIKANEILRTLRNLDPPFTQNMICLINEEIYNKNSGEILRLISNCNLDEIFPLETPYGIGLDLRKYNLKRLDLKTDEKIGYDLVKKIRNLY